MEEAGRSVTVEEVRSMFDDVDARVLAQIAGELDRALFDAEGQLERIDDLRKLLGSEYADAVMGNVAERVQQAKAATMSARLGLAAYPKGATYLVVCADGDRTEVVADDPCDAYRKWAGVQRENGMDFDVGWVDSVEIL